MFPFDLFDDALSPGRRIPDSQEQVDAVVAAMVAEFGFKTAVPWLLDAVAKMAEMSIAAPRDTRRKQRFLQWSNAVQAMCRGEGVLKRSFDQLLSIDDRAWARGMGISLT
jgi:hypothetical protein